MRVGGAAGVSAGRWSWCETEALSTLADGVTLWCTARDRQFVMTQATDAETGLLGSARRMD